MYKGVALGVGIAVCIGAWLFSTSTPVRPLYAYPSDYIDGIDLNRKAAYSNEKYNLRFSYPLIYVLEEYSRPRDGEREHYVITLVHKEDMLLPEEGEGGPSITIDIYGNNLGTQSAESWIRSTNASNFKLSDGNIHHVTLGSVPALSYRWSGLHEGTTVVHADERFVYVFSVTYLQMGDPIVQEFVSLRESVRIGSTVATIQAERNARLVAEKSCVKGGEALGEGFFNGVTRTWWFDANLNVTRPGCNPACVVSADTHEAEINWRCTGLLPSAQ